MNTGRYQVAGFPLFVMGALLLSVAACNSTTDLTRDKARKLLDSATQLEVSNVSITRTAYDNARKDGYFTQEMGKEVSGPAAKDFVQYWWYAGTGVLRQPLRCVVSEVTGITDAPLGTGKIVKFTCTLRNVPEAVNRYTGSTSGTRAGSALFKLFDDGWRVANVGLE